MAITRRSATGVAELYGLSSDTKPTTFGVGSVFYETDTGITYRWSGSGWFASVASAGSSESLLGRLPSELSAEGNLAVSLEEIAGGLVVDVETNQSHFTEDSYTAHGLPMLHYGELVTASGNTELLAVPGAGLVYRVHRVVFSLRKGGTLDIDAAVRFDAAGALIAKKQLIAEGQSGGFNLGLSYREGGDNLALYANLSAASQVDFSVWYRVITLADEAPEV